MSTCLTEALHSAVGPNPLETFYFSNALWSTHLISWWPGIFQYQLRRRVSLGYVYILVPKKEISLPARVVILRVENHLSKFLAFHLLICTLAVPTVGLLWPVLQWTSQYRYLWESPVSFANVLRSGIAWEHDDNSV